VTPTPPSGWSATGARRPILRWGLPDAVLVQWFFVLLVLGGIASWLSGARDRGGDGADSVTAAGFAVAVGLQYGTALGTAAIVAHVKGLGSLRRDFGFVVRLRDWRWVPIGLGLQIGMLVALAPMEILSSKRQQIVEDLEKAGGAKLAVITLTALIVAPAVEELLFRGVLLRALARRVPPAAAIAGSGLAFGLVHLVDPNAVAVVPGLVALGMVSSLVALRTGDLSRSVLLHVGFNSLAVVATLLS
jgi:membrane protease YdiL (CAAX protease family)